MLFGADDLFLGPIMRRRAPIAVGRFNEPSKPSRIGADGRRLTEAQYRRAMRRAAVLRHLATLPRIRADRAMRRRPGYGVHRWKP